MAPSISTGETRKKKKKKMKKRKLQSDKGGGGSLRSSNAALPPPHVRQRRTARTRPERWELKTWRFKVGWKGRRRTPTIRRSSNVFSLLFRLGVSASCPAAFAFSPPVICPHRAQHFPPNPRKSVSFFLFLFLKLTHKKGLLFNKDAQFVTNAWPVMTSGHCPSAEQFEVSKIFEKSTRVN